MAVKIIVGCALIFLAYKAWKKFGKSGGCSGCGNCGCGTTKIKRRDEESHS